MQPHWKFTGHHSWDLTEAKVHILDNPDGTRRLVAFVPKTWRTHTEKTKVNGVNGTEVQMASFIIEEWEEIVLISALPAQVKA